MFYFCYDGFLISNKFQLILYNTRPIEVAIIEVLICIVGNAIKQLSLVSNQVTFINNFLRFLISRSFNGKLLAWFIGVISNINFDVSILLQHVLDNESLLD